MSSRHSHPLDWGKNRQMVPHVSAVDQVEQVYNIYLIIYICVGATEADVRRHT